MLTYHPTRQLCFLRLNYGIEVSDLEHCWPDSTMIRLDGYLSSGWLGFEVDLRLCRLVDVKVKSPFESDLLGKESHEGFTSVSFSHHLPLGVCQGGGGWV